MQISPLSFLSRPEGARLSIRTQALDAAGTVIVFCGGFRSDMTGTKASAYAAFCAEKNLPFVRFDYRGHGTSDGVFEELTLSDWLADVQSIRENFCKDRKHLLIGSSMGGWLGLKALLDKPENAIGFIGLAAAPDFTRNMKAEMTDAQRQELKDTGRTAVENDYDTPYIITQNLLDDGEALCLLDKKLTLPVPMDLIQGKQDSAVDWQTPYKIAQAIAAPRITTHLLEDADHSLSKPDELALVERLIASYLRL